MCPVVFNTSFTLVTVIQKVRDLDYMPQPCLKPFMFISLNAPHHPLQMILFILITFLVPGGAGVHRGESGMSKTHLCTYRLFTAEWKRLIKLTSKNTNACLSLSIQNLFPLLERAPTLWEIPPLSYPR